MWSVVGSVGYLGLEIAVYLGGVGHYGGQWLAGKLGRPWLYWVAMVVGVGCVINALVRVNRAYKKSLQKSDEPPAEPPLA